MQTFSINNIKVYPFASTDQIIDYAESVSGILIAINAEKVIKADNSLIDIINTNIGYCDGVGAVMMAHRNGHSSATKIPGCELWLEIVRRFHCTKSFFLVGSTTEVIEKTVIKLKSDFTDINVMGWSNGYLDDKDEDSLISRVKELKPDIVFVAMGSPKQELLMKKMKDVHPAIYQGLGGSFDLYVGNFKRAPKILQDLRCEWLWRFIAQPKRITRLSPYLQFAYKYCFNNL